MGMVAVKHGSDGQGWQEESAKLKVEHTLLSACGIPVLSSL